MAANMRRKVKLDGKAAYVGIYAFGAALATPAAPTVTTSTTGGTLAASTVYTYRVSATNAAGETLASTGTPVTTGAGATNSNTITPAAVTGATGYKIYGRIGGSEQLLATRTDTTPWVDTGAVTPSGALPASNTTDANAIVHCPMGRLWAAVATPIGTPQSGDVLSVDHAVSGTPGTDDAQFTGTSGSTTLTIKRTGATKTAELAFSLFAVGF